MTGLVWLAIQQAYSQSKPIATTADYNKWHTLVGAVVSPDGLWATYKHEYESGTDTLWVQQIASDRKFTFAKATHTTFSPDSKRAVISNPDQSLQIINLTNLVQTKIDSTAEFHFSPNGKFLMVLGSNKVLSIYDTNMQRLKTINNVEVCQSSKDGKMAAYQSNGLFIYETNNNFKQTQVSADTNATVKNLIWSKSGNRLAWLQESKTPTNNPCSVRLFTYNFKTQILQAMEQEIPNQMCVSTGMQTPIIMSDDDSRLFCYVAAPKPSTPEQQVVEVWDSDTKLVYPAQQIQGNPESVPKLALWNLKNNSLKLLATNEFPKTFLTANREHVLTYSNLTYEPQYEMIAPVDLYIASVDKGHSTLLLSKQPVSAGTIGGSPSGRYINYFKEKHWWIYDTQTKQHTNLTNNLQTSFEDADWDYPGQPEGYFFPGWSADSKVLLLYDKYDVWCISPDKKIQKRLTKGAETSTTYRICDYLYQSDEIVGSADLNYFTFNLSKGLFLCTTGYDKQTGYAKWNADGTVSELTFGNYKSAALQITADGSAGIFIRESFDTPPALYYTTVKGVQPKLLHQSNPHFEKFESGTAKLIKYKNEQGKECQAALFYPSGYQKGKQYPMIVYIYSRESYNLHDYSNPTLHHQFGFPTSIYTNDGYLVLMPDIWYKVGEPGKSVHDGVTAAVNKVKGMGILDEKHIGLIGHSFGGYETAHLLTRTSMFAAAMAGGAVTDIISSFLSVNIKTGIKMDWRFETQQFRMGTTPFGNLRGYLENSTVTNATNITTPLLLWNGKEDTQSDWRQSVELHLALRRLNKPCKFLAYPNQGHVLSDPAAQYDLTIRTKNWFDHYLKGKRWLEENRNKIE